MLGPTLRQKRAEADLGLFETGLVIKPRSQTPGLAVKNQRKTREKKF